MNRNIVTLVLLVFFGSSVASYADDAAEPSYTVDLKGYQLSCMNEPQLFVDRQGWRQAATDLPGKGQYFIDGKYVGYGMCDLVKCYKIEEPVMVKLEEFRKTGTQASPDQNTESGDKPVFVSMPLKGRIKITIDYFSDDQCQQKLTYQKIIER